MCDKEAAKEENPSLTVRLARRRRTLERQLADVKEVEELVKQYPQTSKAFDAAFGIVERLRL